MSISPNAAVRETIKALGFDAPMTDLSDYVRDLCPFDMDSNEGSEWVENADNRLAVVVANGSF